MVVVFEILHEFYVLALLQWFRNKKKLRHLKPINQKLLQHLHSEQVEVDIIRVEELKKSGVEESELDAQVELRQE